VVPTEVVELSEIPEKTAESQASNAEPGAQNTESQPVASGTESTAGEEERKADEANPEEVAQKTESLLVVREEAETENLEETNPHLRRIAAITLVRILFSLSLIRISASKDGQVLMNCSFFSFLLASLTA
jgi:hypothetical protein